jgi:hypothetical protein
VRVVTGSYRRTAVCGQADSQSNAKKAAGFLNGSFFLDKFLGKLTLPLDLHAAETILRPAIRPPFGVQDAENCLFSMRPAAAAAAYPDN